MDRDLASFLEYSTMGPVQSLRGVLFESVAHKAVAAGRLGGVVRPLPVDGHCPFSFNPVGDGMPSLLKSSADLRPVENVYYQPSYSNLASGDDFGVFDGFLKINSNYRVQEPPCEDRWYHRNSEPF